MGEVINNFISELDARLAHEDINLYFVKIDNLPIITLAQSHQSADDLIDQLAQKIGAKRLMSDQLFVAVSAAGNEPKAHIEKLKQNLYGLDTHIAGSICHNLVKKGTSAANALSGLYATSVKENPIFSAAEHDDNDYNIKESRLHIDLAKQIKTAIKNKQFKLAYQPIIEAKSGKVTHSEALLRITDDNGNLKSAGSLIPIAEKMGLIDLIDIYVLELVIKQLKLEKTRQIALNISNLTISNRDWVKKFFDSITPDIGKRMIIEITETTALRDLKETAYFIATLQEAGCQFALDDFGSGYTSFRQVRALSFDYIKLDGSLISDITTNPHNRLLVKSLLEYMRGMNIKTVAEFVENGETAKILMEFGIDYMQGNYFGMAK